MPVAEEGITERSDVIPFFSCIAPRSGRGIFEQLKLRKNPWREIFLPSKTSILLDFLLSCASLRTIPIILKISKYVILIIKYYD